MMNPLKKCAALKDRSIKENFQQEFEYCNTLELGGTHIATLQSDELEVNTFNMVV